jgi:hypothetical protein
MDYRATLTQPLRNAEDVYFGFIYQVQVVIYQWLCKMRLFNISMFLAEKDPT